MQRGIGRLDGDVALVTPEGERGVGNEPFAEKLLRGGRMEGRRVGWRESVDRRSAQRDGGCHVWAVKSRT